MPAGSASERGSDQRAGEGAEDRAGVLLRTGIGIVGATGQREAHQRHGDKQNASRHLDLPFAGSMAPGRGAGRASTAIQVAAD